MRSSTVACSKSPLICVRVLYGGQNENYVPLLFELIAAWGYDVGIEEEVEEEEEELMACAAASQPLEASSMVVLHYPATIMS